MSNNSLEKGVGETIERAPERRSKRQRLKGSCKKYWYWWLLSQILVLGIIAIIGIFGIIPRVAQDKVNDAGLTLHSLEIRDPTPTSFRLTMNSSVHIGHGISTKAVLDPMIADLYITDKKKPFMKIPVPTVHGEGDVFIGQEDVLTQIEDSEAMDEFAGALMANETLKYKIHGRTKLWLKKIHTMVNYNQKIEMKGLNKLEGMFIVDITPTTGNQTDGATMHGNCTIPNPTISTIEMGDVWLKIGVNGSEIGSGIIPGLILKPGNNSYYFRSMIPAAAQAKTLGHLLSGGLLEIGSNGTSIDGVKIPWLSKPLEAVVHDVPYKGTGSKNA